MNAVIDISPDGIAQCLWNEALPLEELGRLEVKRASTVEFNGVSQEWEVRLASDLAQVAFSHKSRAACIAWEIETINKQLLNN